MIELICTSVAKYDKKGLDNDSWFDQYRYLIEWISQEYPDFYPALKRGRIDHPELEDLMIVAATDHSLIMYKIKNGKVPDPRTARKIALDFVKSEYAENHPAETKKGLFGTKTVQPKLPDSYIEYISNYIGSVELPFWIREGEIIDHTRVLEDLLATLV